MKQKLILLAVVTLMIGTVLFINPLTWSFEKHSPNQIATDHIFVPFFPDQEKYSNFCVIQNDDGTPMWYFARFDSGMGFAVYMDPAKCTSPPTYPFKITDVHFFLYHQPIGWFWPVKVQVNIKEVNQGNKCLGPDTLTSLYSETFILPSDSSYTSLGRPMNLSLSAHFYVYQPFFLEIKYLDHFVTGDTLPSLLMDSTVTSADTCNNWGLWIDRTYYEWSDFWQPPPPGDAIIRASGYTNDIDC